MLHQVSSRVVRLQSSEIVISSFLKTFAAFSDSRLGEKSSKKVHFDRTARCIVQHGLWYSGEQYFSVMRLEWIRYN